MQKAAYEMRISDWSSDVCSSDLSRTRLARRSRGAGARPHQSHQPGAAPYFSASHHRLPRRTTIHIDDRTPARRPWCDNPGPAPDRRPKDRKSVGKGKSVSVRVDLGGSRKLKQKKRTRIKK